jgi:DNA-directed RNA polymerase
VTSVGTVHEHEPTVLKVTNEYVEPPDVYEETDPEHVVAWATERTTVFPNSASAIARPKDFHFRMVDRPIAFLIGWGWFFTLLT